MVNKIIKINSDASFHYFPAGKTVQQGEQVTFTLMSETSTATVTFDSVSCFDEPGPISLDGSASVKSYFVTAAPGSYPFTVNVSNGGARSHLGSDAESKRGELDVTTEPPKESK